MDFYLSLSLSLSQLCGLSLPLMRQASQSWVTLFRLPTSAAVSREGSSRSGSQRWIWFNCKVIFLVNINMKNSCFMFVF